jgi:NitT/TauT family transport system substrate-binding protein
VGEAGGRVYLEEREVWPQTQGRYVTTLLVSRATFLEQQPELVKRWIAAHVELTGWMRGHGEEARRMLLGEFEAETKRALPAAVVEGAWQRLEWTHDPVRASLLQCAANAQALGFIRMPLELSRLYDLRLLNAVLREASLPEIP